MDTQMGTLLGAVVACRVGAGPNTGRREHYESVKVVVGGGVRAGPTGSIGLRGGADGESAGASDGPGTGATSGGGA